MIDKVVYFLSEGFQKEGLLVPFGTTYRIAENLIESMDGQELVLCKECQSHEPCEVRNRVWCKTMGRYMKEDGFCSEGVKDNG